MAKFAANLSMLFTEVDFMDRFEAAATQGFKVSNIYSHMLLTRKRSNRSWLRTT